MSGSAAVPSEALAREDAALLGVGECWTPLTLPVGAVGDSSAPGTWGLSEPIPPSPHMTVNTGCPAV